MTFPSIHDVMATSSLLERRAIPHELIPIPRELSADCGMAIALPGDVTITLELIRSQGLPLTGAWQHRDGAWRALDDHY